MTIDTLHILVAIVIFFQFSIQQDLIRIKEEMRDFHNLLCAIEERRK